MSSLNLLHYAVDKLNEIESFSYASGRGISTCPPFYEDVFSAELVEELKGIYKQLYPSREIENISCFLRKFGRIILANDLIGSVMPGSNSRSSSVIMAFWPDRGQRLANIDYSRKSVGIIQYFIEHQLDFQLMMEDVYKKNMFLHMYDGKSFITDMIGTVHQVQYVSIYLNILQPAAFCQCRE